MYGGHVFRCQSYIWSTTDEDFRIMNGLLATGILAILTYKDDTDNVDILPWL